jgi:alpha-galactosidase/6-phospho-beta-glucosidase family protein
MSINNYLKGCAPDAKFIPRTAEEITDEEASEMMKTLGYKLHPKDRAKAIEEQKDLIEQAEKYWAEPNTRAKPFLTITQFTIRSPFLQPIWVEHFSHT